MFFTAEGMKMWMPPSMLGEGDAYWRSIALPVRLPWYVVSFDERLVRQELIGDTILVRRHRDLLDLIETMKSAIAEILCASALVDRPGWKFRPVKQVWTVHSSGGGEQDLIPGTLRYVFEDSANALCNDMQEPEDVPAEHRTLLLEL